MKTCCILVQDTLYNYTTKRRLLPFFMEAILSSITLILPKITIASLTKPLEVACARDVLAGTAIVCQPVARVYDRLTVFCLRKSVLDERLHALGYLLAASQLNQQRSTALPNTGRRVCALSRPSARIRGDVYP